MTAEERPSPGRKPSGCKRSEKMWVSREGGGLLAKAGERIRAGGKCVRTSTKEKKKRKEKFEID